MSRLKDLMLREPPLRLAVAESLTSGRLQALVGAISGASLFFAGGMTAYGLDQKIRHLRVRPGPARRANAVSAAVAEEMARGACRLFQADVAVATTGYAEPLPERGVRDPFAWIAVARVDAAGRVSSRSRRVVCRGASRSAAQRRIAAAAFSDLVAWVAALRARSARRSASAGAPPAAG